MTTKAEIINGAYSQIRISGITLEPSTEDTTLALRRLENMAAEFEGRNIGVNYNFQNAPNVNDLHNLERKYWQPFETNLAIRLLADFGKPIPEPLIMQAKAGFSFLSSNTAIVKRINHPSTMPRGEANTRKVYNWRRFFSVDEEAPSSAETITMYIGDIQSFSESFAAYLNLAETISSYTITADTGLTVSGDSNATPLISYTVTATGLADGNDVDLLQVKIVITTSDGRKLTRIKNFKLLQSDVID